MTPGSSITCKHTLVFIYSFRTETFIHTEVHISEKQEEIKNWFSKFISIILKQSSHIKYFSIQLLEESQALHKLKVALPSYFKK